MNNRYQPDANGFYGEFGGAYVPEMLYPALKELQEQYLAIITSASFQNEYIQLLKNYVGRPSPLFFSQKLSEKYGATIYLKREDLNHTGSHKINNTIGQILLAKRLGKSRIIAETGAGQHGVSTATVCALMDMECTVFMGAVDMERQATNVARMKMLGAKVQAATCGSQTLKDATNEAIREWILNPTDTHYIIGSVVGPHPYPDLVSVLQSIISKEIKQQLLEKTGTETPTKIIACVGGGSNAMGAFYHFVNDVNTELIAVEAGGLGVDTNKSAASIALGKIGVLHGAMSYLIQTYDGQIVEPHSISAGLDYPGIGPGHSHLAAIGRLKVMHATDEEALKAGVMLTQLDGIIPALESAHALAALEKIALQPKDVVVINLSGRGDKDLDTYLNYLQHGK